jgi:hypothetical protein
MAVRDEAVGALRRLCDVAKFAAASRPLGGGMILRLLILGDLLA